jgi:hypothetical protein
MQVKTLFLWSLCLTLLGCSTRQGNVCKPSNALDIGYTRGFTGSFSLSDHLAKKCRKKSKFKTAYDEGYLKGLNDFCSKERGKEQAAFGLPKEKACETDESYGVGYQEELNLKCSVDLAKKDASTNLSSSNELCKEVPKYNYKYLRELKKKCSYSYGKSLGYLKKSIKNLCLDSSKLPSFEKGYRAGLSKIYSQENFRISSEIRTLGRDRKALKAKRKSIKNKDDKIQLNLEINKLEGRILDLQSLLESNKKYIR